MKKPRKPVSVRYNPSFCDVAIEAGKEGLGVIDVAMRLGVTIKHIKRWERRHRPFFEAMTEPFKNDAFRKMTKECFGKAASRVEWLAHINKRKGKDKHENL